MHISRAGSRADILGPGSPPCISLHYYSYSPSKRCFRSSLVLEGLLSNSQTLAKARTLRVAPVSTLLLSPLHLTRRTRRVRTHASTARTCSLRLSKNSLFEDFCEFFAEQSDRRSSAAGLALVTRRRW